MINIQKLIKYMALALAFLLIFNIMSGVMNGIMVLDNIFIEEDNVGDIEILELEDNYLELDIEISTSNIIVKEGDSFEIETNNSYIYTKEERDKLYILEKKYNLFKMKNNSDLVIYVPRELVLDKVSIETGVGILNIEKLLVRDLDLDLGVGKVTVNNLNVYDNLNIDGGASEMVIDNSIVNNLDLDMGFGKLSMTSLLLGNNKIDSGVGEVELNLIGTSYDYRISIDKGVGSAIIDGDNVKDDTYYGTGDRVLDIDGGVGNINIKFLD